MPTQDWTESGPELLKMEEDDFSLSLERGVVEALAEDMGETGVACVSSF